MERLQNETVWTGKRRQERAGRKERAGKSGKERAGRKRQDRKEQLGKYRRESVDGKERVEKSGRKERAEKCRQRSADKKIQKGKYNYKNTNRKEQKAKYRRKSAGRNGEQTSMYETAQEGKRGQAAGILRMVWNRGGLPASCAWFETGGRLPHGSAFRHAADKFSKTEPSARENHVQKVK